MKAYITWGIGYGKGRVLAEANAQLDANLDKIKVKKMDKLEILRCDIVENKKVLGKLKGEYKGIVLQNCAKSEVSAVLAFALAGDSIFIGKGKSVSLPKAEKMAIYEARKAAEDKKLEIESVQHIAAYAQYKKDQYICAIVALVLVG